MYGLSVQFAEQVAFVDMDASTPEGKALMRDLGMIFHGYAVRDRWGGIYWRSAGHSFTSEELERKINEALVVPPP